MSQPDFDLASPFSRNGTIMERMVTPLDRLEASLDEPDWDDLLELQPLDPANEQFKLVLPDAKPENGYGLLVFVPPWEGAGIPKSWVPELDKRGIIAVTAANSGNRTSVLTRRVPLALAAAVNVANRYDVDPERIWISGFSGGSRVALRIALAYPEIFRGALLDGGSDPVGSPALSPPPPEQFSLFLDRSRLALITGEYDRPVMADTRATLASLRRFCFERSFSQRHNAGHRLADTKTVGKALDFLESESASGAPDQECVDELNARIDGELRRAEARGSKPELQRLNTEYGSLAGDRIVSALHRHGLTPG